MKRLFFLLSLCSFLLISTPAWAVTYYVKIAGGNSNDASTYSATSSAGVDNAGVPTAAIDVVMDAASATTGAYVINATLACKTFTSATNVAGTLTHNAFAMTVSGNVTFGAGMTYTPLSTATLRMNATGTLTLAGGQLLSNFTTLTAGTQTLGTNIGFLANKTTVVTIGASTSLDVNGKTVSGNSALNRVLITSATLGTASPGIVNGAVGTFNNVDFRDITFTTAGALDLTNGQTKLIGDCGGNTASGGALTFTNSVTCNFRTAAGGNWDNSDNWAASAGADRVPLPQDDVTFATAFNSGVTITANMPRLGRTINFSGASSAGVLPTFTLANAVTNYGGLNLTGLQAGGFSGGQSWYWQGRSSFDMTSNGQSFGTTSPNVQMIGGTLNLRDAFTSTNTSTGFIINNGTFNTNDFSMSCKAFGISGSATKVVNLGSSTITISDYGPILSTNASGTTLNATNSTIIFSDASSSTKTFSGSGLTYGAFQITGGGTGAITITGSNSFNSIQAPNGGKITLTAGTTQTITGNMASGFGNGTNTLTILSSSGGSKASLKLTGTPAYVNADYLDLTDSEGLNSAGGVATTTWYYGTHSTLHTGVTGWTSGSAKTFNPMMMGD